MTESQAQTAVTGSALVVALIFAYRKLVEPAASASGSSTRTAAPNTGHFVIGFGFTYLTLAILAQAARRDGRDPGCHGGRDHERTSGAERLLRAARHGQQSHRLECGELELG